MKSINLHDSGPHVEDVQLRLEKLGYTIDAPEKTAQMFGDSTLNALQAFCKDHALDERTTCIDADTWQALVDASYTLGDRTLYLRLPNFCGHDVEMLQNALNVLGFHAGAVDGHYGAHTEAALKQFQENIGELGDGMCFPSTAAAILRLHHVWDGQNGAESPLAGRPLGFARAAEVLEHARIALLGSDPITRSIAARIWNLASATTEASGLQLLNSAEDLRAEHVDMLLELVLEPGEIEEGTTMVTILDVNHDLGVRISMAKEMSHAMPAHVILKMPPETNDFTGGFTAAKAQTLASSILDAICTCGV